MIGTMFELHLERLHFKQVCTVVLTRLAVAIVFALMALWMFLPFPHRPVMFWP